MTMACSGENARIPEIPINITITEVITPAIAPSTVLRGLIDAKKG